MTDNKKLIEWLRAGAPFDSETWGQYQDQLDYAADALEAAEKAHTPPADLIEEAAGAIYDASHGEGEWAFHEPIEDELYRRRARAALAVFKKAHTPSTVPGEHAELIEEAAKALIEADNEFEWDGVEDANRCAKRWSEALASAVLEAAAVPGDTPSDEEREALMRDLYKIRSNTGGPVLERIAAIDWAIEFLSALDPAGHSAPSDITPTDDERFRVDVDALDRRWGMLDQRMAGTILAVIAHYGPKWREASGGDQANEITRALQAGGFRHDEVPGSSADAVALLDALAGVMDRYSVTANLDGDDESGLWVPVSRINAAIDSIPLPFVPPFSEPQGEPSDAPTVRLMGRHGGRTQALIESMLSQANERGIRVEVVPTHAMVAQYLLDYGHYVPEELRAALRAASAVERES